MVILHSKAIRKNQHILYLKVPFDVFVLIILYWMGVTSISFKTVNIPHCEMVRYPALCFQGNGRRKCLSLGKETVNYSRSIFTVCILSGSACNCAELLKCRNKDTEAWKQHSR